MIKKRLVPISLRRNADRHVRIVTSKISCAQVKERVVKDSPRSKHKGRGDRFEF
jgi:hypothetical protein